MAKRLGLSILITLFYACTPLRGTHGRDAGTMRGDTGLLGASGSGEITGASGSSQGQGTGGGAGPSGVGGTGGSSGVSSGGPSASGGNGDSGGQNAMMIDAEPAVAEVCKGSAGQATCDGAGVMYQCDDQGVASSTENCASARHCQLGLAARKCASCLPGAYHCEGALLKQCQSDGQTLSDIKSCPTVALCNETAGDCTSATCLPGKFSCQGDVLNKCNANQTGWDFVKMCPAGLCDGDNGECDQCVAGAKRCDVDSVVACNPDGQGTTSTPCMGPTAQCVGNGQCVECAADGDCGDPGTCKLKHCDLASGICMPQPAGAHTGCNGGFCDGLGSCLECLTAPDCGTAPCKNRTCNSGSCVETNADQGNACTSPQGGRVCDDTGTCVDCNVGHDSDCNGHVSVDSCHTAACSSAMKCTTKITPWANCGSGKVCNGSSGVCQTACGNSHLETGEECDYSVAPQNNWTCNSQTCKWTGLSNSSTWRKICSSDSQCDSGETCAISVTFGAYWQGGTQKTCFPRCSNGVCISPPGYTVVNGLNNSMATCSTTSAECMIQCTDANQCPPGTTCAPDFSAQRSVCLGPLQ